MAGGHPTHFEGDLRTTLLDAAIADIDERGIGALSLRSIARRVGVSHAAPAHHFSDRAGLMTALARRGWEQLRAALLEARSSVDDPTERVAAIGHAYITYAGAHPSLFDVMMRSELHHSEDANLLADQVATYDVLVGTIRHAQDSGWAPGIPTDTLASLAWSAVHGAAVLARDGHQHPDPDGMTGTVASTLVALGRRDDPGAGRSRRRRPAGSASNGSAPAGR